MGYGRRSSISSSLVVFMLNPLPYRVLLILGVVSIFLGISWYTSYESAVETMQQKMNLALMVTPILLLIAIHWLSSMENPDRLFLADHRRMINHQRPSEGGSPWGVAALIVVLLIMISYQSTFHDSWFI